MSNPNFTVEFLKRVRSDLQQKKSLKKIEGLLLEVWAMGYGEAMKDAQAQLDQLTQEMINDANKGANPGDTVDGVGVQPPSGEPSEREGVSTNDPDSGTGSSAAV